MECLLTDSWNKYLNYIPQEKKDIYFAEEYVKLYENDEKKALCVICKEESNVLLMPFLREQIATNEYECLKGYDCLYDFETAYGYGGPITNSIDEPWIKRAIKAMTEFLKEEKYLCGFIRFNPMLNNYTYIENDGSILFDRKTIAIKLSMTDQEIWDSQISSKNRNMIRKAEKNGLYFSADYSFSRLDEFVDLYNKTMNRLNADDFYYFGNKYYKLIQQNLSECAFLGEIIKDGKMICGAIFMYTPDWGHYHLEGSNHIYSGLGANNLLLWKAACELNRIGVKDFHLGGGYNSQPDNSLFKFKKSFSKNEKDFYIGKMILNQEKYESMKREWIGNNPNKVDQYSNYLLFYKY